MRLIFLGILIFVSLGNLKAQKVKIIIDEFYEEKSVPGVAVAIRDLSTTNYYAKGLANMESKVSIDSLTNFRLASVSKQFTAMSVFQLIEQNKLKFDSKAINILSELPAALKDVTIGQLINHSSGIYDYENLIPANRTLPLADIDVLNYVSRVDSLYFAPGSRFRYSNTGYCLLALIVERIAGIPYDEAVNNLIFKPLDLMNASVYPTQDSRIRAYGYHPDSLKYHFADQSITSSTKGDGGVYLCTKEYVKWLNEQNPMFTDQFWIALEKEKVKVKDNIYYSMGWFLKNIGQNKPVMFHSGESTGFHNIVLFEPNSNQSIVVFSNRDDLKINFLFNSLSNELGELNIPNSLFMWLNIVYSLD